jgi:tetratricopeptide (TPR) repeat protein
MPRLSSFKVSRFMGSLLGAMLALSTSGCLKNILIDGQLRSTRQGSEAVSTIQDYEVARSVSQGSLGTIEGMHSLRPENPDGLFMLTKAWSGSAAGFMEDDWDAAREKEDETLAEYNLLRLRSGHRRAKYYGIQLLKLHTRGFDEARKNHAKIREWLRKNFQHKSEAEDLLWVGFAWVSEVAASTDVPETVGELYVGAEIVRRSIELDETLSWGMGHTILGAYHARTALAELDEAKKHFDRALEINGGRFLSTKLNLATRYYCFKGDRAMYEKTLKEVVEAGDLLPEARLQNMIAKRRARRHLKSSVFQEDCGFTT